MVAVDSHVKKESSRGPELVASQTGAVLILAAVPGACELTGPTENGTVNYPFKCSVI